MIKLLEYPKEEEQTRNFYDGESKKTAFWNNKPGTIPYELIHPMTRPVMDTDFIVENDLLRKVFGKGHDFLLTQEAQHLDYESKMIQDMKYISDSGIKMCWATVFHFMKTDRVRKLFTLINHIKEHWSFYRFRYQLLQNTYRNDFAFAIRPHILNGHMKSDWSYNYPIKLFYIQIETKSILTKIEHGNLNCKVV